MGTVNKRTVKHANHPTYVPFTCVLHLWRGVTLHGNNPFRV